MNKIEFLGRLKSFWLCEKNFLKILFGINKADFFMTRLCCLFSQIFGFEQMTSNLFLELQKYIVHNNLEICEKFDTFCLHESTIAQFSIICKKNIFSDPQRIQLFPAGIFRRGILFFKALRKL